MLGRQHLRGSHQHSLPSRLDRREQGRDGHHGFATAHVSLQQACHRLGPGQIAVNFCQDPLLSPGELKGQQRQKALDQVGLGWSQQGRCALASEAFAPQPQGQLQQQEFVEHQSGPGRLQLGLIIRPVNLTQGNGTIHQPKCIPQALRQGVRPGRHGRQHGGNGLTQFIGRQPLGEGINRGQSANAIRSHRTGGSLQHLNQGIIEAGAAGSLLDEAADGHRGPWGIQALLGVQPTRGGEAPSSKKTRDPQPTGAVLDVEFVDGKIRIPRAAEGVAATHGGHNRGGAPAFQGTDPHQI